MVCMISMICMICMVVGIICLAVCMPVIAHGITPPAEFFVVTDRGVTFEIFPPDLVPTTDVVSSPYVEFQQIGGLVANGGHIAEAAQYNTVGSGPTYIIDNWERGKTYGIPNFSPMEGELRMEPRPHMYLRTPTHPWPQGVDTVRHMTGPISHTIHNHTAYGEYHEFTGKGRVLIDLVPGNFYTVNLVCTNCHTKSVAVIGNMMSGTPNNGILGTHTIHNGTSGPCTVNSINYTGCGTIHDNPEGYSMPYPLPAKLKPTSHEPYTGHNGSMIQITGYDYTTCPGATHNNTRIEPLSDEYFQLVSSDCIMQNFDYTWWDGLIHLDLWVPLRPGLVIYDLVVPDPTILVDMEGGTTLLQIYASSTRSQAESIFDRTFTVKPGNMIRPESLVVLHDAYSHLGTFTRSTLPGMANHIQTNSQLFPNVNQTKLSHGTGRLGGLLGDDCIPGYTYCVTIFDNRDLPVIYNGAGVIYDARNGAELNRGTDVGNHHNVFGATGPGAIPYDTSKLNLIQAYGVIPISGSISIEEMYLVASYHTHKCDTFVDTTTTPDRWSAPATAGWLRLSYLETDFGADRPLINVPLLPWYGIVCMKTHNSESFRQFVMDDFFVQGAHASFGGIRYIHTYHGTLLSQPNTPYVRVLYTDVVLPGSGNRVMDMDLDLSGKVRFDGVVSGGAQVPQNRTNDAAHCNWKDKLAPRYTPYQRVQIDINVDVQVPTGGTYTTIDGLQAKGLVPIGAIYAPFSHGSDCRHVSEAVIDFEPIHHTLPIEYSSNMPVRIDIKTQVTFISSNPHHYAGNLPKETMYVETFIERLSFRVH